MIILYFWCFILCINSATTGYDGSMLNSSQMMDSWEQYFDDPQGARLGLLNAIYQIGSISSFPFAPILADRFGRRVPIAIGGVCMVLGGILGGFTSSFEMYVAGRFVVGFGNALSQLSCPVLITEICHPQHRGKVTAIYNTLWDFGACVCGFISLGAIQIQHSTWAWRTIALIQAAPALIQVIFIYWIPESPRWLMSRERYDKAFNILAYYHAGGNRNNPTVLFEFQEIKDTIDLEFLFKRGGSYVDFVKTPGNRYRLMILVSLGVISQYSGNALFSNYSNLIYESAGVRNQTQKIALDAGQNVLKLVVAVVSAMFIDKVGRRPLFLSATAGMLVMFIGWTIIGARFDETGDVRTTGYPQIAFIWGFNIAYSVAWSGLLVGYALEILPFKMRARGLMIMNLTVQGMLVLGNYTNPIAWDKFPEHWNFTAFYTIWIAVELVFVYFFYLETKGPTLEEIAMIFDGQSADVPELNFKDMDLDVDFKNSSEIPRVTAREWRESRD